MSLSRFIARRRRELSDEMQKSPDQAFKAFFRHDDLFTRNAVFTRKLIPKLMTLALTSFAAIPLGVGAVAVTIAIFTESLSLFWPPAVVTASIILGAIAFFLVMASDELDMEVRKIPLPKELETKVTNMYLIVDEIVNLACYGVLAKEEDARLLAVEATNFHDASILRLHQLFSDNPEHFFKVLPQMTGQVSRSGSRDPLVKEVNDIFSSVATLKAVQRKLVQMQSSRAKVIEEEVRLTKKLREEERLANLKLSPPSLKVESSLRNLETSLEDISLKEKSREQAKSELKDYVKDLGTTI